MQHTGASCASVTVTHLNILASEADFLCGPHLRTQSVSSGTADCRVWYNRREPVQWLAACYVSLLPKRQDHNASMHALAETAMHQQTFAWPSLKLHLQCPLLTRAHKLTHAASGMRQQPYCSATKLAYDVVWWHAYVLLGEGGVQWCVTRSSLSSDSSECLYLAT